MKRIVTALFLCMSFVLSSVGQSWPLVNNEAKPGARWWWLGSAVDRDNLGWNLKQYADHGIGSLEVTPIYGVQGNAKNNIPYLSDQWMAMLRYTEEKCRDYGIAIWPPELVGRSAGRGFRWKKAPVKSFSPILCFAGESSTACPLLFRPKTASIRACRRFWPSDLSTA